MQIKKNLKRRVQRGLTLIEASMVLALAAVVVAGAVMYYQSASENRKLMDASGELGILQTAIESIAATSGLTGITAGMLADSQAIPSQYRVAGTGGAGHGTLINVWGGAVTVGVVTAAGGGPGYTISYAGMPKSACERMVRANQGTSVIGMSPEADTFVNGIPVLTTLCTDASDNTVAWSFR